MPNSNTILLFQDDASEEIPLAHRPRRARPAKLPIPAPQPPSKTTQPADLVVVEMGVATSVEADVATPTEVNAAAPVEAGAAAPKMVSPTEPEATAKTPMHPQDVDLGIPLQEVMSAYVRISVSYF